MVRKATKVTTLIASTACIYGSLAIADEAGIGTPGNGSNDATDPNDGGAVESAESSSTVETWWNELLEDLGFVTPEDSIGHGND